MWNERMEGEDRRENVNALIDQLIHTKIFRAPTSLHQVRAAE